MHGNVTEHLVGIKMGKCSVGRTLLFVCIYIYPHHKAMPLCKKQVPHHTQSLNYYKAKPILVILFLWRGIKLDLGN